MFKKIKGMVILTMLFCLCGCSKKENQPLDPRAFISAYEGKDNLKDIYTRVSETKLEHVNGNVDAWKNNPPRIGNDRVYFFGCAINEAGDDYESTLSTYSMDDCTKLAETDLKSKDGVFPVFGTNKSFATLYKYLDDGLHLSLEIYDESGKSEETIYISDFIPEYNPRCPWIFAMDSGERIHIVQYHFDGQGLSDKFKYSIASKEGEVFFSKEYDGAFMEFVSTYFGDVVCHYHEGQARDGEHGIWYTLENINIVTGESAKYKYFNGERQLGKFFYTKNGGMLFTDHEGIWLSDDKIEDAKLVYRWINHGMNGDNVADIKMDGKDRIHLAYYVSEKDPYYYILDVSEGGGSLPEIEIAIPSYKTSDYAGIIGEFNKKYPSCMLRTATDYDESLLRTKLIAGSGPVIIDTSLIGFYDNKDYWQSLEEVYREMDIYEELNTAALSLGKIDGQLYGVVLDYSIDTLVAPKNLCGWNYDTFLEAMNRNNLQSVFEDSLNSFISVLRIFGDKEDNSFFVQKNGDTIFESDSFENLLNLCDRYNKKYKGVETLAPSESVLCQFVTISNPGQLWIYLNKNADKNGFAGYPFYDGSYHKIVPGTRLVIRKSATKEEKEMACAFIKTILTYDYQLDSVKMNSKMSVRNDVLKEQIHMLKKGTFLHTNESIEDIMLIEDADYEQVASELRKITEHGIPSDYESSGFTDILYEEFGDYFNGSITREMLKSHLKGRINIYFEEKK